MFGAYNYLHSSYIFSLFEDKYEFVKQFNRHAKRTRFRDLFTESEIGFKTPKTRSLYTSSPTKSMARSQTLPALNAVALANDSKNLERSVSTLDVMKGSASPVKFPMSVLPDLPEEPTTRPTTKHTTKKMGIITEMEPVADDKRLPSLIQVDAWGINPSEERTKQSAGRRSVGMSPSVTVMGHKSVDLMRSMLDHKPGKKKRKRKKPINTRIDEFFDKLEKLLEVPVEPIPLFDEDPSPTDDKKEKLSLPNIKQ